MRVRRADVDDLDELVRIEGASFETDRISRRSFRDLLRSPTAILLVAEDEGAILGDALVLFRKGTAAARLYSIAVDPPARGRGLATVLLVAAEQAAYEGGCLQLRLEVGVDNHAARALYCRAGYREVQSLPAYYEDGSDAIRLARTLRGAAPAGAAPPYYAQTTEFTCGPACLMMALAHFEPTFAPDPVEEVRLWREATMIFMSSGLGGCGPYGMAVALAERGLRPEVHVSEEGPLLLQTVGTAEKRRVMRLAQHDFRARAEALKIPVHFHFPDVGWLADRLEGGALAALLISGNRMFGKRVPHWVLAYAGDDAHVMVHDPWVEEKRFESATDAAAIPIPHRELDRMWRWGKTALRALVLIERARPAKEQA